VEHRKEMLTQYLEALTERYQKIEEEPYSFRAKLLIRKEIEGVRGMIEDMRMEEVWENLDKVFNTGMQRPDCGDSLDEESKEDDTEKFKKGLVEANTEVWDIE